MFGSLLRVSINASIPELLEEKRANKANAMFQSIGALVLFSARCLPHWFMSGPQWLSSYCGVRFSYAVSGMLLAWLNFPKVQGNRSQKGVFAELKETMGYIRDYSFLSFFLKISSFMNSSYTR